MKAELGHKGSLYSITALISGFRTLHSADGGFLVCQLFRSSRHYEDRMLHSDRR